MLYKFRPLTEFKMLDGDAGGFEGYASKFGVKDDGGDIVDQGAYSDTLSNFVTNGFISLSHDWDALAIGMVHEAKEDSTGLFLRTEYHSTPAAQDARRVAQERLAKGKSVSLSIGYQILPGGMIQKSDGRHLTKLGLFEVAQVNVPMLRSAQVTTVKGRKSNEPWTHEEIEATLTEWTAQAKEGRTLNATNRDRVAAMIEQLQQMLDEANPKASELAPLFLDYHRILTTLAS